MERARYSIFALLCPVNQTCTFMVLNRDQIDMITHFLALFISIYREN